MKKANRDRNNASLLPEHGDRETKRNRDSMIETCADGREMPLCQTLGDKEVKRNRDTIGL